MPFKSLKQRKFLFANKPKLAHEWAKKYGAKIGGGKIKTKKVKRTSRPHRRFV